MLSTKTNALVTQQPHAELKAQDAARTVRNGVVDASKLVAQSAKFGFGVCKTFVTTLVRG